MRKIVLKWVFISLVFAVVWVGCPDTAEVQVENVIIQPTGEYFVDNQVVTLTCATPDATIYYTLDSTEPTVESLLYSPIDKFTINTTTTVKTIALKTNFINSIVTTAEFKIEKYTTIFVEGGTFSMGQPDPNLGGSSNIEQPVHTVTVSSFYMGKYEITQKQ